MAIRNVTDAIVAMHQARQPKPSVEDVLERIEQFARQGYPGIGFSAPLPDQTVAHLVRLGFEVEPGNRQVYWDTKEDTDGHIDSCKSAISRKSSGRPRRADERR